MFADTHYWLAIFNPKDQWHRAALMARDTLRDDVRVFTTDEVLTEFLNAVCAQGRAIRESAVAFVETIRSNPNVTVLPSSSASLARGMRLFKRRPDKGYSLTDCISMETMRDKALSQVLTNDKHFTQELFTILIHQLSER